MVVSFLQRKSSNQLPVEHFFSYVFFLPTLGAIMGGITAGLIVIVLILVIIILLLLRNKRYVDDVKMTGQGNKYSTKDKRIWYDAETANTNLDWGHFFFFFLSVQFTSFFFVRLQEKSQPGSQADRTRPYKSASTSRSVFFLRRQIV